MYVALPPLAAETMFSLGSLPVTNSYINTTIATLLFILAAFFISRGIKKYYTASVAPKGFLNFVESIVEVILGYCDQVTRDRKKSLKFMPIAGALFLFILVSNWMGLIPGTGSIGVWHLVHGEHELVPLFRPGNTDLNMTVAMAVLAVGSSHILGIAAIGFFKYANKFIKLGDLWQAVKSLSPVKMLIAFIEFFVGLIEIFSEIAKMVSLSLRLFGNIFAGEVLLTVLASLIAYFIPLPFMALELLVGLIQAVVFSMLTLVYLNMATMEHGGHDKEHETAESH